MKYSWLAFILLIIFYFTFYQVHKNTSFMHNNSITDIIAFTHRVGNIEKLNLIALLVVMFLIFFQGAVLLYCINQTICIMFKNANKERTYIGVVFFEIILFLAIFYSSIKIHILLSIYGKYLALFLIVFIPLYLSLQLLFDRKGKVKNEK